MIDGIGKLRARLRNYGYWLMHDVDIGPKYPSCISIESRHIPEAGEVWADDEPRPPCPDVSDAEALHLLIRQLDRMHQYAIAVEYGGTPCVMRWRRVGSYTHTHMLEMAETLLIDMLRESA
jgi:hypothetical protein